MRKGKKNSSSPSIWDPSSGWKQYLHSVQHPLCRASIFGRWVWTNCHPLGPVIRRHHVETLTWLWKGHPIWSDASQERAGVWNWKAIPFVLAQRTWAEYVSHEMPLSFPGKCEHSHMHHCPAPTILWTEVSDESQLLSCQNWTAWLPTELCALVPHEGGMPCHKQSGMETYRLVSCKLYDRPTVHHGGAGTNPCDLA